MRPLCVVDTETTGFSPHKHELIEIAAIKLDPSSLAEIGSFESKISPARLSDADPKALEVNHYSAEEWAGAPSLAEVMSNFAVFADGATLVGHNVSFDKRFIEEAMKSTGVGMSIDYHCLDTVSLAWPMRKNGSVRSLRLDSLAEYFKLDRSGSHRAMADARCCLEIFRRLTEIYAGMIARGDI